MTAVVTCSTKSSTYSANLQDLTNVPFLLMCCFSTHAVKDESMEEFDLLTCVGRPKEVVDTRD